MAITRQHLPGDHGNATPAPGTGSRIALVVLMGVALLLAVVGPDRVGGVALGVFDAYVAAQQKMLEAAGNLTSDGRAEFAVLLTEGASAEALRKAVARMDDVRFEREADLSGWVVITTMAGNRAGLDAVIALPESRLVVPNRGLWICH